jgi:hypothetical protein
VIVLKTLIDAGASHAAPIIKTFNIWSKDKKIEIKM